MTNDNLVPRIRAAHDGVEPSAAFRSRVEAQLRGRSMTKYQRRRWFPYAIAAAVAATAAIVAIITANTKPGTNANTQKPTVVSHTASSGPRIVPSDIEGAWTLISVVEGQQRLSATGYQTVLELATSAFRFTTKFAMTTGPYDLRGDSITFRGDTAASGCIESRNPTEAKLRDVLERRLFEGLGRVALDQDHSTLTLDIHDNTLTFTRSKSPSSPPQPLSPMPTTEASSISTK